MFLVVDGIAGGTCVADVCDAGIGALMFEGWLGVVDGTDGIICRN